MQAFTAVRNVFMFANAAPTNGGAIFAGDIRGYLLSMTLSADNVGVGATNRVQVQLGTGAGPTRVIAEFLVGTNVCDSQTFDYKGGHGAQGLQIAANETNIWIAAITVGGINVAASVTVRPP